jgi:MraZ protein
LWKKHLTQWMRVVLCGAKWLFVEEGTVSLLHGEYELTLDDKNRLLIPAEIRRRLNLTDDRTTFFIKLGRNGRPWFYSATRWAELARVGDTGMDLDGADLDRIHLHYAMTHELEWDKQGRTVIPERILRKTSTGKEVMLIGAMDHLELWNRAAWEEHMDGLIATQTQQGKTRQALPTTGNA